MSHAPAWLLDDQTVIPYSVLLSEHIGEVILSCITEVIM